MKRIILFSIALMMVASAALAAGGKTAVVDVPTVFDKTKLGKKYQAIVKEYYESRKKILDLDADEIDKLQDDYTKQKQAKTLTEKAQKEKEDTLNRKMNEFQKKREEFNNELAKKYDELSNEFNQQLVVVIKDLAKREKVSMVLSKSINIVSKAEVPSVLYSDEDLDLTERIIAEMDKKEESKKEESRK